MILESTNKKIPLGTLGRADSEGDSSDKGNMASVPAGFKPAGAPLGLVMQPSGEPAAEGTSEGVEASRKATSFIVNGNRVFFNQSCLVCNFLMEHEVFFNSEDNSFYVYNQTNGLWESKREPSMKKLFMDFLERSFSQYPEENVLQANMTDSLVSALVRLLKGYAEKNDPFRRTYNSPFIHTRNGILDLSSLPDVILRDFDPGWYSRNAIGIEYIQGSECPRFLGEVLGRQLNPEDMLLFQKWFGSALIGGNIFQRFLIITGKAGTGKGLVCEVVELCIGPENISELRTSHLGERFETASYLGKTLLCGKDAPGDFLQAKSAHVLKKLVGHDLISCEKKGVSDHFSMRGEFGILINTNSKLKLKFDSDLDAWRRRLLILEFKNDPVRRRIPNFARILFETEGSGILNWAIEGAALLLGDIDRTGDIILSREQDRRIDVLLSESDSVHCFVEDSVVKASGETLTTSELVGAYVEFCGEKDWEPFPTRKVEFYLPDIMLQTFGVVKVHDIIRDGKSNRGYRGIKFK